MTTKKNIRKKTEAKKILDAVSGLEAQSVIEEIGTLQSSLQNTLAGLSGQISTKIEQMRGVEEAIRLKQEELQELYEIEQEAMRLEEMRSRRLDEEQNWQKRQVELQDRWEEDSEEREKRWQREEEEHAYTSAQKRKRFEDDFNNEVTARRRAEETRREDLEKQWAEREKALASKEGEFENLKTQVEGFETRLKSEVSRAEAIVTARVKKEYEHELAMLKKDIEAERVLNATKISALDDTITHLHDQIEDLQKQLVAARADAKEVTNAALQSASGRQAMQALQRAVETRESTKSK